MTRRPINVTRLTPLQRGFLIGVRRARLKAKAEFARQAADYDAELLALRDEFDQLALAHHAWKAGREPGPQEMASFPGTRPALCVATEVSDEFARNRTLAKDGETSIEGRAAVPFVLG
jgi:DNA segregation ATPase FtsK/SpoIIIE-like protein